MLQQSASNDLKNRIVIKLTKVLTKLEFDYSDDELDTIVNEIMMTIGDWTKDSGQSVKEAFVLAMQDKPRRVIKNRG